MSITISLIFLNKKKSSRILHILVMICTFESGFCDLINEKSADDFDWLLGHYTKTPTTGPNGDHTFGHGMYRAAARII